MSCIMVRKENEMEVKLKSQYIFHRIEFFEIIKNTTKFKLCLNSVFDTYYLCIIHLNFHIYKIELSLVKYWPV